MSCLFCKIIAKEIPASIVYEDANVLAFNDIAPQSPVHVLVIPKKHIDSIDDMGSAELVKDLFVVLNKIARDRGVSETGYRIVVNHGKDAGQAVAHLHFHLLGGRHLSWPPG